MTTRQGSPDDSTTGVTMAEMARHLGAQLCEVWGLDPNKVKRIVISLDASALVFAEVTIVTDGEISEMLLKLRPVEPAQDENCGDFWCEICPDRPCGCPCHQVVQPGLVPCPRCKHGEP